MATVRKRLKQKATSKAMRRKSQGKNVSSLGKQTLANRRKRRQMNKALDY